METLSLGTKMNSKKFLILFYHSIASATSYFIVALFRFLFMVIMFSIPLLIILSPFFDNHSKSTIQISSVANIQN